MKQEISPRIKLLSILILGVVFFGLFEVVSFLLLDIYPNLSYDKNMITQDYETYLSLRNNSLGWDKAIDDFGNSRNLPNRVFVQDTTIQIDLYGDSFTEGGEVENDSLIWSNVISKELKLIVNNKGVGGYGSDQSYLKFKLNPNPHKIVVLSHLTENIIRNVNQFRHLIYPSEIFDFKPRFIVDSDSLKLIKIPTIALDKVNDFKKNPNIYLDHEYFKLGKETGIFAKEFPYTLTLLKSIAFNWKIRAAFGFYSGYQPFYEEGHKSQGVAVTKKIIEKFVIESKSKKLIPIATIIPTSRDFEFYEEHGYFPYKSLVDSLNDSIPLIDFGKEIQLKLDNRKTNYIDIYVAPGRHMNEKGHMLLSEIFVDYFNKNITL